jgi:hypothetical protein
MKKAKDLFDHPAGQRTPRYVSPADLDIIRSIAAGECDAADVMTMHPSDLRAAVVMSSRKSYRHAYLQGVLVERASIDSLIAQAETLPPDSPVRGLVDGIIHARVFRSAGTGGATEKARG